MNTFDERKAEILRGLQHEAAGAAIRRRRVRATGGVCAVMLVAAGAWWLTPGVNTPAQILTPTPAPIAGVDERIVRAPVNLADYAMSDDELLAALDESGEAYTMVWVNGQARLIEPPSEDAPSAG